MTAIAERDAAAVAEAPPRLWGPESRALALGALALVTLGALENRAVNTVLPTMLGELGSINSIGLVSAVPLITYMVSIAVSGWWADRSGPLPVLWTGAGLFATAQVLVGTSIGLPTVVVGRLISGMAEGMLDVSLTVLVAVALDERLRSRLVALFTTAWILPSVVGPVLVGTVAEQFGWRTVFLAGVALLVPTMLALRPAMRRARRTTAEPDADAPMLRSLLPWAVVAAAALVALNEAPLLPGSAVVRGGLLAAAVVVVWLAARRLLPAGTFAVACGIGGMVALRGLLAAAFMGVGGFLPLVLTELHGYGPAAAGISLSITGVMWSTGSHVQSRWARTPRFLLSVGFGALTAGLAVTTLLAWTDLPPAAGLAGWAVAGLGIGMTSSTLAVQVMGLSDETNQGRNNAGSMMAASMAMAVFMAGATTVISLAEEPSRLALGIITTAGAALGLAGLAATRRVCGL